MTLPTCFEESKLFKNENCCYLIKTQVDFSKLSNFYNILPFNGSDIGKI